jgi:hypothetical protein
MKCNHITGWSDTIQDEPGILITQDKKELYAGALTDIEFEYCPLCGVKLSGYVEIRNDVG